MKIGIVGASGLIGRNLLGFLRERGIDCLGTYVSRPQPDLIKFDLLVDESSFLLDCTHVVIGGAITNLDQCLSEADIARNVNVTGTIRLVDRLARRRVKPIFLSSDQVFDGIHGDYSEEDSPSPVNHYGRFKLDVENYLREHVADHLILRLSKTYSRYEGDGGLYWDILRPLRAGKPIKAAYNQIYNPTDVQLVCKWILMSIDLNLAGVYHVASPHALSRYEFALAMARELGLNEELIEAIDLTTLPLAEKRALNSSLNVTKWMAVTERGMR